ncbi:MAG TPA: sigma-70 family RNA polymerase sigma factor [Candidatus Sulfotelmatobacter sp.]|nr:sigma-70 family RNA polymerase sigma factor [Candidatus Sulfotelmatobacter sp.]
MTVSILTMRPLAETLTPRATVETSNERAAESAADAEARQVAAAIGRGENAAFEKLYERYHRRLLRLALMLARGDELLAHDAVQGTFIVAAQKLRHVDGEAHLWNWLAQVARQQITRICRQRKRDTTVVDPEEFIGRAIVEESDTRLEEILDAALAALDLEERQIVERFYFDRLSQKEIAEQLNITPKAVSSRLERARAKLRLFVSTTLSHET